MSESEAATTLERIERGELSDEEVAAYNRETESELKERADKRQAERKRERQQALDALASEEQKTAEVESGEVTLTVKTHLNEDFEHILEEIAEHDDDADLQRRLLPQAVAWLVESPEEYTSPALWRDYAREYGRDELGLKLWELLEPRNERIADSEVVRGFRRDADGDIVRRSEQSDRDAD